MRPDLIPQYQNAYLISYLELDVYSYMIYFLQPLVIFSLNKKFLCQRTCYFSLWFKYENKMTDDTEEDKSKTIVEKTSETIEKTNATLENAGNLIGTIKWVAIAFVALVILIISYTLYRTLSAPVRAVGSAAEGVSDAVSSGAEAVKDGASDIYNRLLIQTSNQRSLDRAAESAFKALSTMPPTEANGVRDNVFRRAHFVGAENKICSISPNFGNGPVDVIIAADNKAYATAKAVGAKSDRLLRMVIRTGADDIALNTSWDEDKNGWVMKWKATTVNKEIEDNVAEQRILDILTAASKNCR